MNFLKSLFSAKKSNQKYKPVPDFEVQVKKAIEVLGNKDELTTDKEAIDFLIKNDIDFKTAEEIILFLPIAFIRHWLTTVKWTDTYLERGSTRIIEKKFSETESYQIIWKVTSNYFNNNPDKNTIFNIGGRSAEFNAINPLLMANPQLKVEDIELSQTAIIRTD